MRTTTLGELVDEAGGIVQTGPFGSQLHAHDYSNSGVAVVMPQNIRNGRLDHSSIAHVTTGRASGLSRHTLQAGDIVYSRRGDVEKCALVLEPDLPAMCGTGSLLVRVPKSHFADSTFLAYLLQTDEVRKWVRGHAVGATMLNLNTQILREVPLVLPPLPEQQAIADVLGALDDKIAANHALANTADDLVRSLYAELNASTITIADLARNTRDAWAPGNEATTYVGLEHLPRRHMWLTDSGAPESVTSNKSRFKAGDILFGKLRPYFHKVVSAPTSGVCSTDILVIRAFDPGMQGLVLAATSSDEAVNACTIASSGTKMPRTNWKTLGACPVRCGSTAQNLKVSHKIMTIRDAVEAQLRASSTLAALRDTLLPALMDGTLRVKDAERTVSEAL
ncbi:restriction endonuclease subunit S [Cutibacterium avidum]|uniref:restriction endonuclease subunit S n=1 Tax=Cutibacterium avidum TaxID=33010 RepID=UPI00192C8992|nr:restriction endonuclease subunit S [Cutibacterium avidum]QQY14066.1 restriction endonuclease subunit S [Cutibacterium avidum]